jgi:hypothetical protein
MFEKRSDRGYRPALDGIERTTLVHGDETLMTEFRLRKGAVLPRHSHPHELPGGVEHGGDILEDSVAVEVFSPVRDDYVPGRV